MTVLTTTALRGRWRGSDRWLSDGGARGAGRLTARLTRDGVLLYYQYFHHGRLERVPLGPYDEAGERGLSLVKARARAADLAEIYRGGMTDLKGHIEREREATERQHRAAEEAARQAQEAAQRSTLKQLLDAYVAHLERHGKPSARDAKSIFNLHVFGAAPELGACKAAEVSMDEFVGLLAKLTDTGKGRTAAKCRSYLRAAYALAIRSRTDPDAPLIMRTFGVAANPLADIDSLSSYNRTRDRVLNGPELIAYLRRIQDMPKGPTQDALLLGLYLGGQRPAQLVRVRPSDVDLAAGTVVLLDSKGARRQPRKHVLPLLKEANAILSRRIASLADGEPLFSADKHNVLSPLTISKEVAEIANAMVAAKESREPFQLRDIRRTVETMLASLKVSGDVRAQLQSHGLGGVQQRHYDRHDYMREKRQALGKWMRHLDRLKSGKTKNVNPITKSADRH